MLARHRSMPRLAAVVAAAVLCIVILAAHAAASLDGLSDEARAVRLLRWHGDTCTPKIVERAEEGVLRVVCADGAQRFRAQLPCEEGIACFLGFDVACWDREV
jgi:hypothetical protein